MIKLYRNIPSLHRFVELAPLTSIRTLIAAHGNDEQTQAFATFAWPTDAVLNGASQSFRLGVLAICAALDAKQSAPLDGHARRIITLSEGKGIEAVQAVRNNLYRHDDAQQSIADEYVAQPDHFGRTTVIYLRAPDLFSEAEQYFYAEHHRNYGRLYEAYDLDCDDAVDFEWTDAKQSELEILLHERLGTIGRCLIQYLPFEQKSASGGTSTAHLFLIRHAGEMNSVQQVCDDLSSAPYYYRAPVEATLLFQPEKKSIEVFAAPDVNRFLIASSFSAVGVNADLSGRPVSMRQYNLRRFYRSLSLPQEPVDELGVIDVRVLEAQARPQNFKRCVTLKVDKHDDIEAASKDTLGDNNIFRTASLISKVVINVRFMKQDKEVNFPITLSMPNRCNLGSRLDPQEREIGFAVLECYGIMRHVVPLNASEEANLFSALLKLYESEEPEVRRSTLEHWGVDIEMLRAGGFLKPKGRANDVWRLAQDGNPIRLLVRASGALLVADDPLTGQNIAIDPLELERFDVIRGWVAERVVKGLRGAMQIGQRIKASDPVTKLGTLIVGDEDVPVYLARRLNRLEAVTQADAYLRGERQVGYGIVLTATEASPQYLGANVVVWLGDVLTTTAGEVSIDKDRLLRTLADGKARALAARTLDLIVHNDLLGQESATLMILGKDPWPLLGLQCTIVERLVKAHKSNNPVLQNKALFDGLSYNHPQQAFQGAAWKTYLGHPSGKTRGWVLHN